jgi:hypothetical protein
VRSVLTDHLNTTTKLQHSCQPVLFTTECTPVSLLPGEDRDERLEIGTFIEEIGIIPHDNWGDFPHL